jgi:hypothetical protein
MKNSDRSLNKIKVEELTALVNFDRRLLATAQLVTWMEFIRGKEATYTHELTDFRVIKMVIVIKKIQST